MAGSVQRPPTMTSAPDSSASVNGSTPIIATMWALRSTASSVNAGTGPIGATLPSASFAFK